MQNSMRSVESALTSHSSTQLRVESRTTVLEPHARRSNSLHAVSRTRSRCSVEQYLRSAWGRRHCLADRGGEETLGRGNCKGRRRIEIRCNHRRLPSASLLGPTAPANLQRNVPNPARCEPVVEGTHSALSRLHPAITAMQCRCEPAAMEVDQGLCGAVAGFSI
jgi:hypothetical protein